MTPKQIQIIDTTIPQGGFQINHSFLPEQVVEIAQGLKRSNIEYMEVSHGCGVGSFKKGRGGLHSEKVYLKALAKSSVNLKYSLLFPVEDSAALEIESLKDLFHIGRVGVYFPEIADSKLIFDQLSAQQKSSMAILKGISGLSAQQVTEAANSFKEWGINALFLEDTFGDLQEDNFKSLLESSQVSKIIPFGFSSNQNLGLGLQLARCAAANGAEWFDGSLMGFGKGGGTLPLELLVHLLKKGGWCDNINLIELTRTAKNYALPAIRQLPYPQTVDFVSAKFKLEYFPGDQLPQIADLLEIPLEILLKDLKAEIPDHRPLSHEILQNYLAKHQLDFNVVKSFFESGKIPKA